MKTVAVRLRVDTRIVISNMPIIAEAWHDEHGNFFVCRGMGDTFYIVQPDGSVIAWFSIEELPITEYANEVLMSIFGFPEE